MRIINGRPVPEEHVDAWVAEAEAGYDIDDLRTRARSGRSASPSQVIPVGLTAEELAALESKAERENLNRSEAIRRALDAWLAAP